MKNKRGFTLIELLAVIVVLATVMVLATNSVLPMVSQSREKAFRIEATNAVKHAEDALELYKLNSLKLSNDTTKSCINNETKKMCFTIDELIDLQLYQVDKGTFSGRVDIDISNSNKPVYTLYFKKNDEFRIINQNYKNYIDNGELDHTEWNEDYNSCTC